jgi:hypothetical protein
MASRNYLQHYADGTSKWFVRKRQGRIPSGLGSARKHRLYIEDENKLMELKKSLGQYYNENEIVRMAVHVYLSNSVGTELLIQ